MRNDQTRWLRRSSLLERHRTRPWSQPVTTPSLRTSQNGSFCLKFLDILLYRDHRCGPLLLLKVSGYNFG
ncbi:hypothetical protein PVAP13_5NG091281 [Panicum virgatum]|uniref:Uncharacterized protein n=1 Tax=Panicum virgatum TaxID=38727 RepID=A0A8T0RPX5_PANVG|nr:hypothetical protein PVAP13_5NG091281 [Panicum virgatum]